MSQRLDHARSLYLATIRDGDVEAIHRHAGDRFTQHSTLVRDGPAGFKAFFTDFLQRHPQRDITILRSFVDGRHVFLHAVQHLNDGEFQYVTADIFDTDDEGRLVEHWDAIAELAGPDPSGRTQVDGPTEPTDLELTEPNKAFVRAYLEEVLAIGAYDRLGHFVATSYVEHHVGAGDGLAGLAAHLMGLEAAGRPLRYATVHLVLGSGNFVATLAEVHVGHVAHAVIDLFRLGNGRIVEHWDVSEDLTPEATWVNSGKF